MSEALHRKYRPKNLEEYIGNEDLKQEVKNFVSLPNRPQVLCVQGPSGCGKTTVSRMIARMYCCENYTPEKGVCGTCTFCKQYEEYIRTGNASEVYNIHDCDGKTFNVAKAYEMIEEMSMPIMYGTWRVYIIDEAHLLSSEVMGTLLRVVEEPEPNCLIIFCTTNPEKLLDTLRTRCQRRLTVKKPTRTELVGLLARVCKAEGHKYDTDALSQICIASDYVIRKALIWLEKVIGAKGEVTKEVTIDALKVFTHDKFAKFLEFLLPENGKQNILGYVAYMGKLRETDELKVFLEGLIAYFKRGIYIANGVKLDGTTKEEMKAYNNIFAHLSVADVAHVLRLFSSALSGDIEMQMLNWGYEGIHVYTTTNVSQITTQVVPKTETESNANKVCADKSKTLLAEQSYQAETIAENRIVTEEEKAEYLKIITSEVTAEDVFSAFAATAIEM